jgi:hypothetical protein
MENQVLEIEGGSLEEVRAEAKAKTPPGLFILSEKVLSDGKAMPASGLADTAEEALALATGKVPEDVTVVGEKLTVAPGRRTIEVEAWDEAAAKAKVKEQIPGTNRVESIVLKTLGRKGVLGIGKTPNTYSAAVFQPALFEVSYKGKAKIRVEIGERTHPPSGYCQFCGKAGVPAKVGKEDVHYFCSSDCSESYLRSELRDLISGGLIINVSGGDISGMLAAGREAADQARIYCWSCGKEFPMKVKSCPSCGKAKSLPA